MKKFANVIKMTIGLALVLVLAISSFNQPSLAVASTSVVAIDAEYAMPQWWAEAGAAAAAGGVAGGVSGAVVGAFGAPGIAVTAGAGAVGGALGGFAGYAVSSLFGNEEPAPIMEGLAHEKLFDR